MGLIASRRDVLFLLATLAMGAAMVAVFRTPHWDYQCYVNAARLIDLGRSSYSPEFGTQHLYPPLIAYVFLWVRAAVPSDAAVFAIYQVFQLVLLGAAYLLTLKLARRSGVSDRAAPVIAAVLLIASFPILYTLHSQNINLVLIDAALLAMLYPRAAVSGLALAVGTQLKLYPALLLPPLWVFGYRRIALWWAIGMALPLLSSGIRHEWLGFFELLPNLPKGEAVFDNSVTSAIERGWRSFGHQAPRFVTQGIAAAIGLAALSLVAYRLSRARLAVDRDHAFLRSCAEWTAVVLLLSPIAWPEHFVLAVPLALVVLAEEPRRTLPAVATLLVLMLPRTPLYPFSHHHLIGLVMLLSLTPAYVRVYGKQ